MPKKERWHIKGPRKFGDKRYKFDKSFSVKESAEFHAESLRKRGYSVRITTQPHNRLSRYRVWARLSRYRVWVRKG